VFEEPPEYCGHGQHVAHALTGLGGARHNGDDAVGGNLDEGLRSKVGRGARTLSLGKRRGIKIQREAATRKRAQLKKRSAIDAHG
jgi:hypothetical protein